MNDNENEVIVNFISVRVENACNYKGSFITGIIQWL
jgi:hypothetical protein